MRTPFGTIAQTMSGPRASGRTYGMIKGAPQGATLLARDSVHAQYLRGEARAQARDDLKVEVVTVEGLRGRQGPFIPDHFTVEKWLWDAEREIQQLLERAEKAEAERDAPRAYGQQPPRNEKGPAA